MNYRGSGIAKAKQNQAHARAIARGSRSARSGEPNPYAYGTQCWILFEKARGAALASLQTKP